jgi:SAM-dependent methyltransferase
MEVLAAERLPKCNGLIRGASGPLHEVRLRCPRCLSDLNSIDCSCCGLHLEICEGIVDALPPERAAHYARFMRDYECIRKAEGRGSTAEEFYCQLPYCDVTGKNSGQWRIRARTFDVLVHDVLRQRVPAGGRILDLGAGNCWMSFRLVLAGYAPCAVDLLTNRQDGLGAATHYRGHLPELFPRYRAESSRLPFQSGQFDAVIFNASFHYAEDAEAAFSEAVRCTSRSGIVVISDTPWYRNDASGRQMVAERQQKYREKYGSPSDSLQSLEYLTDERLQALADHASITWAIHRPHYGLRWKLRPLVARLRNRREPSQFRIYVARKTS